MLLNAGFALGLFLRAGAAFWSRRGFARLFARPGNLDHQMRRPDGAGRETSSEGGGPTAAITPRDLAKGVSVDNAAAVPCCIFSANPDTAGRFRVND